MIRLLCVFALIVLSPLVGSAAEYFIAVDGKDDASRDGRSPAAAWASLAFACERIPEGEHILQLGPGEFVAEKSAVLKSGFTVRGVGSRGERVTRLIASAKWKRTDDLNKENPPDEYLISMRRVKNVVVRDLVLESPQQQLATGGLYARDAESLEVAGLHVHDFRWAGLCLEHSRLLNVHDCLIERASLEKHGYRNGLIRSTWIKESEIHHCRIVGGKDDGYGYKGSGHVQVALHHNVIIAPYFAIESAHENEFGLDIHHNHLEGCVSVPKSGQGADPTQRGHDYSVRVHHNRMTDSYSVEGPRNHFRLDHNHIRIERTGGRVYTHHGGKNHGPVWIDHNIVENLDRAFVWMNEGLAEQIHVFNNTVLCADAGQRTSSLFGAWSGERMTGWVITNNVFICPTAKPRDLFPTARGVPDKITATNNLLVNVTASPPGNLSDSKAEFRSTDLADPATAFLPTPNGNLAGRGVKIDLPFAGTTSNLGARQAGEDNFLGDVPSP